jgi:sugar lactone lactonase YvrE
MAQPLEATCVLSARAQLGECPLWSHAEGRLYWVDIDGRAVHCFDPVSGIDEVHAAPGRPTALARTGQAGRLLVAIERRLAFLDLGTGAWHDWVTVEPDVNGNRLNDGRCDPVGRFWVGSMFDPANAGRSIGALYRISGDGAAVTVRTGVGVANGLAFSPEGRTMYFADTPRRTVWEFDYDADTGEATNERVFLDFSELPGKPDGACVDADGCYWTACVYGWAVARITPGGMVDRIIALPVEKPTMPAFGGADLSTMFITSIGGGGSHPIDPGQPEAGGVFAIDAGVQGLPEPAFTASAAVL